jgi:hypothetical protein
LIAFLKLNNFIMFKTFLDFLIKEYLYTPPQDRCPIAGLPNELILYLFSFLDTPRHKANLALACKRFYEVNKGPEALISLQKKVQKNVISEKLQKQLPALNQAIEQRELTTEEAARISIPMFGKKFNHNSVSIQAANQEIKNYAKLFKQVVAQLGITKENQNFPEYVEAAELLLRTLSLTRKYGEEGIHIKINDAVSKFKKEL